jgi:hypothetical protein
MYVLLTSLITKTFGTNKHSMHEKIEIKALTTPSYANIELF